MTVPTILVDGHVLDCHPQGTCAYIAGLYGEVAQRGIARVLVAAVHEDSVARWFPNTSGVDWVRLQSRNKFTRLALDFDRLAARWRPDYMHFQYITPLRKRSRWIVTIHDLLFIDLPEYFPWRYRVKNRLLFARSARRADLLLTVSDYSRRAIATQFAMPLERIHVTTNGIDGFAKTAVEAMPGLTPGRFFLYVSRYEPRKNQHGLLRAFREMADQLPDGFDLVLVGSPAINYPAFDAELAQAAGRIRQEADLSRGALAWLYRNAAASIYPSFAEGFGIPPLEAVAAGGVSYCAHNTAMRDLAPYVHGTFDAADINDIKRVMRRAVAGTDAAKSPSLRARLEQSFSWQRSGEQFARALETVEQ